MKFRRIQIMDYLKKNSSRKTFVIFFTFCHLLQSSFSQKQEHYDLCVYGGTSAGVIAAYAGAKMGKSVILIAQGPHLGGLTSGGLGYTDIGNKYAITGMARDFYRSMGKHYGKFEQWIFEPHVAEQLFKQYIKSVPIKVIYGYFITGSQRHNSKIANIILQQSDGKSSQKTKTIVAKMYIDCSYEGDLMAMSGVSFVIGRESNSTYGETYNGVELRDKHQFPDSVDPYKNPGEPSSGLLWGISKDLLLAEGSGDKKIQSFNYRICLSDEKKNLIPIVRPLGYDSTHYELLLRLIKARPEKHSIKDFFSWDLMPNHKTDINNNGAFSTDMIGMNYDYPTANYAQRVAIIKEHEDYTKGLLYFVGHDLRVPETMRKEMDEWGYPRDEYADNHHWSPQLYIRESRRMVGDYIMTQSNCQGLRRAEDGIALAAYTMDSHNCERIVVNGMVKNEGDVQVGGFGPYPVSYRSIIPKRTECQNLLVPVCLSASHIAYGSIRMEPVFMVLAQSAAAAACLAIDDGQNVQDVPVEKLRRLLKNDPLFNKGMPEILVNNRDSIQMTASGEWKTEASGGYITSFLSAGPSASQIKKADFIPTIARSGAYKIYSYFPKIDNPSSKTTILIFTAKFSRELVIKRSTIKVEGQTSGEWVDLGKWFLEKGQKTQVIISTKNADGNVVADSIVFVPAK
jgi:FAD dependent oxidoreductase